MKISDHDAKELEEAFAEALNSVAERLSGISARLEGIAYRLEEGERTFDRSLRRTPPLFRAVVARPSRLSPPGYHTAHEYFSPEGGQIRRLGRYG